MLKEKLKYWVLYMLKEKLKYWVFVYVKGKTEIVGVCI